MTKEMISYICHLEYNDFSTIGIKTIDEVGYHREARLTEIVCSNITTLKMSDETRDVTERRG